jgi:hypothetical protein
MHEGELQLKLQLGLIGLPVVTPLFERAGVGGLGQDGEPGGLAAD